MKEWLKKFGCGLEKTIDEAVMLKEIQETIQKEVWQAEERDRGQGDQPLKTQETRGCR